MNKRIRRLAAGLTLTAALAGGIAITTAGTAAADTHWGITTPTDPTQPTATPSPTPTDGTATPLDTHWG